MKKMLLAYLGQFEALSESDAKKLTHINLAFGSYGNDGSIRAHHPIADHIPEIRKWNPDIKIVLSMVQHQQDSFTKICSTPELIKTAAKNSAEACLEFDYDGIDLDWEYPCVPSNNQDTCKEDKYRFTAFCQALRDEFDAIEAKTGRHYIVSIAAGADLYYCESTEMDKLANILDYVNVMTYDLKCGFHALVGHHTNLYSVTGDYFMNSCDQALRLFERYGVPREKLLLGGAFYSRKWENIPDRNHGLLEISRTGGGYGPDFATLDREYINKNGYVRYWDEEAQAPWLFNGSTFISYDDEQSWKAKAEYVNREGFAGVFYWEHKCDSTRKLLNAIYENLD